jgi:hypothetical protein
MREPCALEIPQPVLSIYLFCYAKSRFSSFRIKVGLCLVDLCRRHSQVGSLAGAVHLLNDNAGVPRLAQ